MGILLPFCTYYNTIAVKFRHYIVNQAGTGMYSKSMDLQAYNKLNP